jgi:hypothetical protein
LNADSIRKLFEEVRKGKLSPDDAVARLRHMPFEDLGFAKVDHHRAFSRPGPMKNSLRPSRRKFAGLNIANSGVRSSCKKIRQNTAKE